MRAVDIIAKKRDGGELTRDEIAFMVHGYVQETIPDYQAAAWLMAICWRGMSRQETADLTLEMAQSGDNLDLSDVAPRVVGVLGDRVGSLVTVLAPVIGHVAEL